MKTKTELRDFRFKFAGYGHYKVTYISPVTGKEWSRTITDMPLIDATKNSDDYPKRKDLDILKKIVKYGCAYPFRKPLRK
jgi:hypothetical protein